MSIEKQFYRETYDKVYKEKRKKFLEEKAKNDAEKDAKKEGFIKEIIKLFDRKTD